MGGLVEAVGAAALVGAAGAGAVGAAGAGAVGAVGAGGVGPVGTVAALVDEPGTGDGLGWPDLLGADLGRSGCLSSR